MLTNVDKCWCTQFRCHPNRIISLFIKNSWTFTSYCFPYIVFPYSSLVSLEHNQRGLIPRPLNSCPLNKGFVHQDIFFLIITICRVSSMRKSIQMINYFQIGVVNFENWVFYLELMLWNLYVNNVILCIYCTIFGRIK